jgi:transposase
MRYELTDHEWTAIKPMLPNKPRGVPRVNDRRVLNGIFWVLRSGAPWRDLPTAFGPTPLATTASSGGGGPVFGAASWKRLPLNRMLLSR